jgi:crossover junction endodeoxyribonuclease RuvC
VTRALGKASAPPRRIPRVYVIVLGIDPGVANTGYGVVARQSGRMVALDGGVVETAPGRDAAARLAAIHERVGALLDAYHPDAVALEDVYFGINARSAFAVGQARGVVMLAAGQRGLPCASYTPQQIKAAVCGSGRAQKGQVQRMVQRLLSLAELPAPDHAADALAVAICHANGAALRAAVGRAAPTARSAARATRRGIGEAMPVTAAERSGDEPRSARQTRGRA